MNRKGATAKHLTMGDGSEFLVDRADGTMQRLTSTKPQKCVRPILQKPLPSPFRNERGASKRSDASGVCTRPIVGIPTPQIPSSNFTELFQRNPALQRTERPSKGGKEGIPSPSMGEG